jgi:hypothetical protein
MGLVKVNTTTMATTTTATQLLTELSNINSTGLQDDPRKQQEALALAKKLTLALESPINRVMDMIHKVR